jgi:hypothetical protein
MMKHAVYSPSRLSRVMKCPGSVKLISDLMVTMTVKEEPPSSYAQHGTMLHGVIDKYYGFHGGNRNKSALDGLVKDDIYLVDECADYLDMLIASKGHQLSVIQSESKVDLSSWGLPDIWGTSDCYVMDPIARHVDVLDWKFGSGVTVYAKENPQLLAYAAGRIKWPAYANSLTVHIVQPAIEHFDTWDLTVHDLYDWVHGKLAIAINNCESTDPLLIPGIDQCRWCDAKNHCYARTELVQEQAIELFDAQKSLDKTPNLKTLSEIIKMAPLVEKAIKDVVQFATKELELGREFPGYKLVQGKANRAWVDEGTTVAWLSKNTNIEDLFNSKLKSPSQIEKEAKLLKKNDQFKILYNNPPGKITLAVESDARPAIQTTSKAIDVFQDYKAPDKLE